MDGRLICIVLFSAFELANEDKKVKVGEGRHVCVLCPKRPELCGKSQVSDH